MAKAPVPGLAKTRLAAVVGDQAAAGLAAAALLDTIDACTQATSHCVIALTGVLEHAARAEEIRAALAGWTILWQRGDSFGQRLANAHLDAGPGPLIQIGSDTPQVTPTQLREVADLLVDHDTVLGPADDGGWWVLGLARPAWADALTGVEMSTARTGAETRAALEAAGAVVVTGPSMRDVDDVDDAAHVAELAPDTRFAHCWALCSEQALAAGVRR